MRCTTVNPKVEPPTLDLRSLFKGVLDEHMHVDTRSLATRVFPDSAAAPALHGLMRA